MKVVGELFKHHLFEKHIFRILIFNNSRGEKNIAINDRLWEVN